MFRLVNDKKQKFIKLSLLLLLAAISLVFLCEPTSYGYYGLSGLGLYGLYGGLYGGMGLYGGGLYGLSSLYSGLGMLGMYGGLGSLFGGLGMYGLYGGLYGLYGMGMLGGLYGGLYGLYGMGGLGLYGMGLGGFGDVFGTLGLLSMLGLTNPSVQNIASPAPLLAAEQAGSWSGSWYSLIALKGGIMTMNLTEDPITLILSGQVNLLLNKITSSIPADVTGPLLTGTSFVLTGGNQNLLLGTATITTLLLLPSSIPLYNIELNCTLTTPTTMTGTYLVNDLLKFEVDYGNFNLSLAAPVI